MTVIELTDNNFDEALQAAELPLLVDFLAPKAELLRRVQERIGR